MAIKDQINRIKNAKASIKEVVNQDFNKIGNQQIDAYPDLIAKTAATYKTYVPWKKETGTDILTFDNDKDYKVREMTIDGNSYQAPYRIPKEYQEVEYIESTGTQWINSGISAKSGLKAELEFEYTETPANSTVFGERLTNVMLEFVHCNATFYLAVKNSWDRGVTQVTGLVNTRYKAISYIGNTEQYLKINDITIANTMLDLTNTYTQQIPLYIFASNTTTLGVAGCYAKAKLYSCKVYDNDVLVRDYIPCYRKSDNVIGLYDLVTNTFFTNAGTGTFLKGADVTSVNPSPESPINVEVVKSYNLYNKSNDLTTGTFNSNGGATITKTKDLITIVTSSNSGASGFYSYKVTDYDFDRNTDVTLSFEIKATTNSNVRFGSDGKGTKTLEVTTEYQRVDVPINAYGTNDIGFYIYNTSRNNATLYVKNIMFNKGTTTKPYLPYGSIATKRTGKNLLNKEINEVGKFIGANGVLTSNTQNFLFSDYVKVKANETYTISANAEMKNYVIAEYDESKNWIKNTTKNGTSASFITGATTKYVRVSCNYNYQPITKAIIDTLDIQLEIGEKTSYEPYQESITYIDLKGQELCKIGDIEDELDISTGVLTKRINKIVVDGSESGWSNPSANRFNLDNAISDYKKVDYSYGTNYALSDNYPTAYQATSNSDFNYYAQNYSYAFDFGNASAYNIKIKDTRYTDLTAFKNWLATNNVTIYYILATPETIQLDTHTITTQIGQNNIEVLAELEPNKTDLIAESEDIYTS